MASPHPPKPTLGWHPFGPDAMVKGVAGNVGPSRANNDNVHDYDYEHEHEHEEFPRELLR